MGKTISDPRQQPLFIPPSGWVPPQLPSLTGEAVIALDTETCDPGLIELGPSWFRGGGFVAGISLAWGQGHSCYLPIAHGGGDNLGKDNVTSWLRELLAQFTGTLALMNGFYDLGWLRTENIHVNPAATLHDVMMVEALLDENKMKYNLASIAHTYGCEPKDETLLREAASTYGVDPKGGLWQLPARYVGPYAERDAALTLEIYHRQLPAIASQRLEKVVKLEHDIVPLLIEMRWRGVRVDVNKAEEQLGTFMSEYEEHRRCIQQLTGYLPDVWSADSCAVSMDKMNIRYGKTQTGKPSFTDDWLSTFPEQTVPWFINKSRKAYRAAQTFCKGMILDHADRAGRIHCEFHPLRSDAGGTVGGRLSSSNPNLQQVPVRAPMMNTLIRGLFLPEEGERWAACDYSQQEPRLTIHYAVERGCTRADVAAQKYNDDPNTDYHNFVAGLVFGPDFTPAQRKIAKNVNLGLAYGMGGAKLCRSLGLPTKEITGRNGKTYEVAGDEGQAILDQYNREVPFIKELSNHYAEIARVDGQLRTLSGRTCRFPFWEPNSGGRALPYRDACATYGPNNVRRAFTYKALNRKIQGGSADMIKLAMRNLWREGIVPMVTIHDELGVSVKTADEAKHVADVMVSCVKLRVPLKVDIDIGTSWGEAKPLKEED